MNFLYIKRKSAFALFSLLCLGINLNAVETATQQTVLRTVGNGLKTVGSTTLGFAGTCVQTAAQATGRVAFEGCKAVGSGIQTCAVAVLDPIKPHANIVEWLYSTGNWAKNHQKESAVLAAFMLGGIVWYCREDLRYAADYKLFLDKVEASKSSAASAQEVLQIAKNYVNKPTIILLKNMYYALYVTHASTIDIEQNVTKALYGPWWWYTRLMLRSWNFSPLYTWDGAKETALNTALGNNTHTTNVRTATQIIHHIQN
jgi:hypothetical protein